MLAFSLAIVWIVIKKLMGETSRKVQEWIFEYKMDLKKGNGNDPIVRHNSETTHNFNFKDFKYQLVYITKNKANLASFITTTQLNKDLAFPICLPI